MRTDLLTNSDERSEELRYVTSHFKDLQGLRLAPVWAAFLVLSGAGPSLRHLLLWQRAAAGLAIILPSLAWLIWSNRWYEHRYGRVTIPERTISSGFISILHPGAKPGELQNHSAVFVTYIFMALSLAPHLFHRFDGRFGSQIGMLSLILFVVPRCIYATTDNSQVRLRQALSIAGAGVICAVYGSYLIAQIGEWSYLAFTCATLLLLDLYDHWLLTRLLSGGRAEHSYE